MPDARCQVTVDGTERDFVPLAFLGMVSGIAAGTALITGSLWLVRTLQIGVPARETPDLSSPAAFVFLLGSLGGVLLAAIITWNLLGPIGSTYRQGGLSLVAAFATVVAVTVLAFPADLLAGRWGLLALTLLAVLAARRLAQAATRAGEVT